MACSLGGIWMNERLGFTPMGYFGGMFSGKSFDVRGLGSHLWEILLACSLGGLWM